MDVFNIQIIFNRKMNEKQGLISLTKLSGNMPSTSFRTCGF